MEVGFISADTTTVGEVFVGRGCELETLAVSAEQVRSSRGPVVVCIHGEEGIGKTALLNRFLTTLDGFTVLRATCDPSESDMPLGLVGQLAGRVPKAQVQRYPFITKLTPAPGAIPTPALSAVGVQLRLLIDELLDSGPVTVAVDDLQWADWTSVQVLRVALRQRHGEPLLVLAACPSSPGTSAVGNTAVRFVEDLGELVHLPLAGLDAGSVATLASLHTTAPWSRRALEELCRRTEGHPLYLQLVLADSDNPRDRFQVPGSLVATMRLRLDGLDTECRRLLDALAVLNAFVPPSAGGAVAGLADPQPALQRLLQLGLVQWQGAGSTLIGVAHELQREAVYTALTPTRRRELHTAAVSVVEGPSQWAHRVAAAQQSDTKLIAAELEEAAWERIAEGDTDLAATWLLWAADLADRREDRERRLLTAVIQLLSGRRMDRAHPLLESVQSCAPSPLKDCALGVAAGYRGAYAMARERLTAAMKAAQVAGPEWVVAEAGNFMASLACWHGLGEAGLRYARQVLDTSGAVAHLAAPARSSMFLGHLLVDGPEAALARVSDAVEPWTREMGGQEVPACGYWHACMALAHIATAKPAASERHAQMALSTSPTTSSEAWSGDLAYFCLSLGQYLLGAWERSAVNAEHCISVAEGLEHSWACSRAYAVASLTTSGRGEFERAQAHVEAAQQWAYQVGPPQFMVYPALAQAVLSQARGDHEGMAAALLPLWTDPGGWIRAYRSWWLPLLAEALVGTGQIRQATSAVEELQQLTRYGSSLAVVEAWLSGLLLESHGAIDEAAAAYTAGLALPERPENIPLHRARLEQAYGRLLSAQGMEHAAIAHLRHAHSRFQALGAAPFLKRCREDLVGLLRIG
ncbi:AAA family ATPase [Streptomyces sp. NBC_01017]|uniref:ATP-binding protein n=1 Tax=Streptomyces sp. NBC_01017 TaxID=2903721 RepID=UPI0038675D6A|nr:AAA family ATPase [Streptomyces sp. NBC_01017]WSV34886.1 AAA family ATPase [Streptomyces sp. NBC_01017]